MRLRAWQKSIKSEKLLGQIVDNSREELPLYYLNLNCLGLSASFETGHVKITHKLNTAHTTKPNSILSAAITTKNTM